MASPCGSPARSGVAALKPVVSLLDDAVVDQPKDQSRDLTPLSHAEAALQSLENAIESNLAIASYQDVRVAQSVAGGTREVIRWTRNHFSSPIGSAGEQWAEVLDITRYECISAKQRLQSPATSAGLIEIEETAAIANEDFMEWVVDFVNRRRGPIKMKAHSGKECLQPVERSSLDVLRISLEDAAQKRGIEGRWSCASSSSASTNASCRTVQTLDRTFSSASAAPSHASGSPTTMSATPSRMTMDNPQAAIHMRPTPLLQVLRKQAKSSPMAFLRSQSRPSDD